MRLTTSPIVWIAVGLAGWLLGAATLAEAASGGADGTYTVTMTLIEVSQNGGASYTTLFSGSQVVNIASANAGATVAGLADSVELPEGTYDTVRVTLGSSLLLKGYVNFGTTTIYTNNDADGFDNNAGGGANRTDNGPTAYAVSTFTIPVADRIQTITGLSLPVAKDKPRTCIVTFNTASVLTQSGGTPSVGAPSVTISSR